MSKCRYCGVSLPGDWRDSEHRKICKTVSPEVRYIHSGLPQKGYPDKKRKPCALVVLETGAKNTETDHIRDSTKKEKEMEGHKNRKVRVLTELIMEEVQKRIEERKEANRRTCKEG